MFELSHTLPTFVSPPRFAIQNKKKKIMAISKLFALCATKYIINVISLLENKGILWEILTPLVLTAAVSATDAVIQMKIYESGMITLIISKEEIEDIIRTVKSLEQSSLLIKGVSETIENEAKEQKRGFLHVLLVMLH